MQPFHGRCVWDKIIHNCCWAMAVAQAPHSLSTHCLPAHQASECSAASHADTRDFTTMQVSTRLTILLWPENGSEESCQIRKVAGKYRGLRERPKLVWRDMWVQQEALQIPVAKETNQQLQIRAECWERNTQFLVFEKTSMANLCSWAQH